MIKCKKCKVRTKCTLTSNKAYTSIKDPKGLKVNTERKYICPECKTVYYTREYIMEVRERTIKEYKDELKNRKGKKGGSLTKKQKRKKDRKDKVKGTK